jgi:U3 small nucleolar RNA-associated protein 10
LNKSISGFLALCGPFLMDAPTGKVLEWLVRRFRYAASLMRGAFANCPTRINEFNLEAILALFLPYHETPHFAKMVTILHIKFV